MVYIYFICVDYNNPVPRGLNPFSTSVPSKKPSPSVSGFISSVPYINSCSSVSPSLSESSGPVLVLALVAVLVLAFALVVLVLAAELILALAFAVLVLVFSLAALVLILAAVFVLAVVLVTAFSFVSVLTLASTFVLSVFELLLIYCKTRTAPATRTTIMAKIIRL